MNITTGQKLVLIPTLKAISGTIGDEITIADNRFEAVYIPGLNEIIVGIKDGASVAKGNVDTAITLTVGGVKITTPLKFKVVTSKPTVKIDKVYLPKSMLSNSKTGTTGYDGIMGCANVKCTYKLGGKVISIDPISITPVSHGKSTITKVDGEENMYKDSKTGAILTVNEDNTISISGPISGAGTIAIEIKFPGDVTIKKSLSIKKK